MAAQDRVDESAGPRFEPDSHVVVDLSARWQPNADVHAWLFNLGDRTAPALGLVPRPPEDRLIDVLQRRGATAPSRCGSACEERTRSLPAPMYGESIMSSKRYPKFVGIVQRPAVDDGRRGAGGSRSGNRRGDREARMEAWSRSDQPPPVRHQKDGSGLKNVFPWRIGRLVRYGSRAIEIVLEGLSGPIEVNGVSCTTAATPHLNYLEDPEIASILSYVLNAWGNDGGEVSAGEVSAARRQLAGGSEERAAGGPAPGDGQLTARIRGRRGAARWQDRKWARWSPPRARR
ncbi:MAG: hypothetical protein U5R48_01380 [Gammaproteobacteria bacterium]|nr:hypothetical protein [Gammaproteobacteria bacterium]